MSVNDAGEVLVNTVPAVILWGAGAIGFLALLIGAMWVGNKWPFHFWGLALLVVAYYGHALWLIATLLGLLTVLLYDASKELAHMRESQAGVAQVLVRLVDSVDGLKSAVEGLDPDEKASRKARQQGFEAWRQTQAAEEQQKARLEQRPMDAEAEVVE